MRRTERGFGIYTEFRDANGSEVRVQDSSSATRRLCWVFAQWTPARSGQTGSGEHVCCSPHLTAVQARRVAKALLRFANGEARP